MEEQLRCLYLDGSIDASSKMSRRCIGDDNSTEQFSCSNSDPSAMRDSKDTARMNDIMIQRGIVDFSIAEFGEYNQIKGPSQPEYVNNVEGFTNSGKQFIIDNGPGKSSIAAGQCPDGFKRCPVTGNCIQVCRNCVYRDNMKSKDYNKADPCFPEGTYNGVTNDGDIKCTCGSSNQYCSEDFTKGFTADGMMMDGKKIIMNVGLTSSIASLFNYDYL
jgi:hypothetical protein|tara:strand:+ start:2393 stop:3043 length:651 start_codon:yes stop_codon:yes gene_type:complete